MKTSLSPFWRAKTLGCCGLIVLLTTATVHAAAPIHVDPRPSIHPGRVIELSLSSATNTTPLAPGGRRQFTRVGRDGADRGLYVVPEKRLLVITSVHIFPQNLAPGAVDLILWQRRQVPFRDFARARWTVPQNEVTQLEISPGLLIGQDFDVSIRSNALNDSSVRVKLYGYVTNAR